jgi:hypothetical protein
MLRSLVDPSTALVRRPPRDEHNLMIAASNSWALAYDNLSHIPDWFSDILCCLATGGGYSTRTLYENDAETIFQAQRPVILNGIEEVTKRADLLDRSVVVELPPILPSQRKPEEELWSEFDADRPQILGALLDAVAGALANVASTSLISLPRMADFARWATAAEHVLGWAEGDFMSAYDANRAESNDIALDAEPIAAPLLKLMETTPTWSGTAEGLRDALEEHTSDTVRKSPAWPKNGQKLSGKLKRITPNLAQVGIQVANGRTRQARIITLTRIQEAA